MLRSSEKARDVGIGVGLGVVAFLAVWFSRTSWQVPSPDFYDFLRVAEAFQAGEWPESFKRAPVYPGLLVAFQSFGLSAVDASQLIGAICIGLMSGLLYAGFRTAIGWAPSLVASALVAGYPDLIAAAHGGLLEPVLMVGVVGWMAAVARGHVVGACLFAALAGATRAEGLLLGALIPFIVWDGGWKQLLGRAMGSFLALGPGIAWILLGRGLTQDLSPYVGETDALGHAGVRFLILAGLGPVRIPGLEEITFATEAPAAFGILAGLVTLATLLGLLRWSGRHAALATVLTAWLLGYAAIHTWFTAAHMRYVVPMVPVYAWAFLALVALPPRPKSDPGAPQATFDQVLEKSVWIIAPLGLLAMIFVGTPTLALGGLVIATVLLAWIFRSPVWLGLPLAAAAIVGQATTARELHRETGQLWSEAEPTAAWIRTHIPEHDRIIVYHGAIPWLVRAGIEETRLVPDYNLKEVQDFDRMGARWLIWTSTVETLYSSGDQWQLRADRAIYRDQEPLTWLRSMLHPGIQGWEQVARISAGPRESRVYRLALDLEERRRWALAVRDLQFLWPGPVGQVSLPVRGLEEVWAPGLRSSSPQDNGPEVQDLGAESALPDGD
ncbi:MAG TPA: hypothetical protein PLO61_04040 [Fimbriimonadaceae bacterium]|nr:hypothetical protein [Fimbriimonadaceae bacterium]HRJ32867.1 hypothetical protein [Fimbriimonadaceae bacterium]